MSNAQRCATNALADLTGGGIDGELVRYYRAELVNALTEDRTGIGRQFVRLGGDTANRWYAARAGVMPEVPGDLAGLRAYCRRIVSAPVAHAAD